jgi:hypothetical protein
MTEQECEIVARFLEAAESRYYANQGHIPHGVTRATIGWLRTLPATPGFALAVPRVSEAEPEEELSHV